MNTPTKQCNTCGDTLPLDFFSLDRGNRHDGHQRTCKPCQSAYRKAHRVAHPELQHAYNVAYYAANRDAEQARVRANRARDPDLTRKRGAESLSKWRARNPGSAYMHTKRWRQTHPEQRYAQTQRYAERHPDRVTARHAQYRRTHRQQAVDSGQRRRARQRNAPLVEHINRLAIAERDGWRCHICGKAVTRKTMSLDHLIPLFLGGPHTAANVALAHLRCNQRRGVGKRIPAQLRLLS
jgi:5-methylcytosine-specific restriction endonuclease McrA